MLTSIAKNMYLKRKNIDLCGLEKKKVSKHAFRDVLCFVVPLKVGTSSICYLLTKCLDFFSPVSSLQSKHNVSVSSYFPHWSQSKQNSCIKFTTISNIDIWGCLHLLL